MIRLVNIPIVLLLLGFLTSCTKEEITNQAEKHIEDLVQTGLPVVAVNTPQNVPIVSKDVYIKDAKFASGGVILADLKISHSVLRAEVILHGN